MNPQLLRVTNRIIERSRETRFCLSRPDRTSRENLDRSSSRELACGNLAHGFAACQPEDSLFEKPCCGKQYRHYHLL